MQFLNFLNILTRSLTCACCETTIVKVKIEILFYINSLASKLLEPKSLILPCQNANFRRIVS